MHLQHEGSKIGVKYHLIFVEDTLEYLRAHFKFFAIDDSMKKFMSKSDFSLFFSFQVKF